MATASVPLGPVVVTKGGVTTTAPVPTVQSFITGALVLTVSLAWSSAVQATIDTVWKVPAHSATGKIIYAGVLTGSSLLIIDALNRPLPMDKLKETFRSPSRASWRHLRRRK